MSHVMHASLTEMVASPRPDSATSSPVVIPTNKVGFVPVR
jgi:hypothetical protein